VFVGRSKEIFGPHTVVFFFNGNSIYEARGSQGRGRRGEEKMEFLVDLKSSLSQLSKITKTVISIYHEFMHLRK
jgi:hypothetical protein